MPTSIKTPQICPCCGTPLWGWLKGYENGRAWSAAEYTCGHVFGTAAPVERKPRVNLELAGMMTQEGQS